MADVEATTETSAEVEGTVISKTVETKVSEDGNTVITEETTIVEVNGVHDEDSPEKTTAEAEVNNAAEVAVTDEKSEEKGENGDSAKEEPESAVADTPEEESKEVAAVEGGDEAITEEKKEEAPPKVILHQYPPGKDIPSTSPFCLKLETFLRANKIPYENLYGVKMGKKGKLPWIEYKGERVADTNFIIDYLNDKFEVDLDKDLTSEQAAIGRAVKVMLEENTNWTLVYNRYVDSFNNFKKIIAPPSGGGIGFNVQFKMFQRKVRSYLDGQGIGRHSRDEIYSIAERDLKALSDILGEKEFLLGDNPSSFDCSIFGIVGNILYGGMDSPLSAYIKENATNLISLCDKMREAYWSDWTEMILGEKAEPSIKKGFSFRKKKSKPVKAKEDKEESAETPEETPAEDAPAEEAPAPEAPTDETPATEVSSEEALAVEEKPIENGEVKTPESPSEAPAEDTTTTTTTAGEVKEDTKESEPTAETSSEPANSEA